MNRSLLLAAALAVPAAVLAEDPAASANARAVATVHPLGNGTGHGTVTFKQQPTGVEVAVSLSGLSPGPHGFHLHENGDCSAETGDSAGKHFNPAGMKHGGPSDPSRHAGDLGNIIAEKDGVARMEVTDSQLHLTGADTIIGRSVIVHESADDLKTDPSGNSGKRIACGVIGMAAAQ